MQKLLRFVSSFLGIFILCSCVNILGWEKIITHDELQNEHNLKNAVWEADSYAAGGELGQGTLDTLHAINCFVFGSSFSNGLYHALSCIETVRQHSSTKLRIWSERIFFGIGAERIYYECISGGKRLGEEYFCEPSEKIDRIILDLRLGLNLSD